MKRMILSAILAVVTLTSAQACGRGPVRQFVQNRREAREMRHSTACQFSQQPASTSPPVMAANYPTPVRNLAGTTFQAVGNLVLPVRGGACANGVCPTCPTIPATNLPTGR